MKPSFEVGVPNHRALRPKIYILILSEKASRTTFCLGCRNCVDCIGCLGFFLPSVACDKTPIRDDIKSQVEAKTLISVLWGLF